MSTVKIGRVEYQVIEADTRGDADLEESIPYELHGPRGARYGLMRNIPHPERLFMINLRGFTKGTPDVWFTDRNGVLELLR